jgi:hypothetical protein
VLNPDSIFTLSGWVRRDAYNYYPSADPFNDSSPDFQSATIGQVRTLLNAGALGSVTWSKGIHNVKAGVSYQQWFLDENDTIAIVDATVVPSIVPSCLSPVTGQPIPATPPAHHSGLSATPT